MSEQDHHDTPEQIRACPICQMLIHLRFWSRRERLKQIVRGKRP